MLFIFYPTRVKVEHHCWCDNSMIEDSSMVMDRAYQWALFNRYVVYDINTVDFVIPIKERSIFSRSHIIPDGIVHMWVN